MTERLSTAGLARASANHPWRVLIGWLLVIVIASVAATGLGDALTATMEFANEPESLRGQRLVEERLLDAPPQPTETVLIRSETLTVDDPAFQSVVEQTTADLAAMDGVVASAFNVYQAMAMQMP